MQVTCVESVRMERVSVLCSAGALHVVMPVDF